MSNPNPSTSSPHHPKFSQLNDTPLRLPSRTASTSVTVSQTPTLPTKRNPRAPFNLRRRRASSYDELTAGRPGLISTAPFSSASIRPKPWSSHRHQNSSKSSGGSGTSNLFSGAAIAYSTFPSVSPAVASALWAEETESPIGEPLSLGEVLDHRPAAHFSEDEDEEEPVYHRRHRRTASSESFLIAHQTPPPAAVSSNNNNSTTGNSKFGRFGFIKPKGIRLKRRTRSASPGTEYTPAYTSPNFRHQTSLSDTPGSPTSSPINPVEHLDANLISVQSGALQSFLLSIMDPSITTTPFSWFFRGLFFGALVVIVTEALILYKVATWLFNPARPAPHTVIHPDTVDEAEEETRGRQKTKVVGDEDLLQTGMGEANSNIFQAPDPHYHPEEWPDTMVEYLKMALSRSPEDVPVIPPKSTANPPPPAGTNMPGGPNIAAPGSSVQAGAAEGYYVDPPMYAGPSESVHWLNVALHRFFMELRVSPTFKDKLKKKMSDKISMKLQGNSFLADVRVLKTITEDLAVMLEGDLTYMGGGSVTLEVTLTSGIMIPARVYLEKLSGKVRIRVPAVVAPDMMGLAFEEDPGANLRVDTPITVRDNEFVRDLVNKVLGKLVRKVFLEQWVLPAWRVFFLPMMEPAPAVSLIRMDKYSSTTARPLPPHRRHGGLTSRYEHLWAQSTAPENLSKRRSGLPVPSQHHWDIFSGRSFPLTTIVSDSPTEPDRLENALVPLFMNLVREDSEDGGFEEEEGGAVGAAWNTSGWRTLKHRGGIHVQRKRVSVGGHIAEVMRAFVKVQCDPARVYGVLSKPDHQMHVEETFLRSDVIKHFDERRAVRHMAYQAGRSATKEYLAFEVKKTIVNEETKAKETAPATHSAAPLTEASTKGKEPASGATASAPTPAISINKPSEAFIYVCRSVAGVRENQGTPPTPTAETSPTSLPAGSEKPAATTAPPSDETPAVPGPRHRKVTPNANAVASEETAATGSSPSASRTASRSSKFSFPGTSSSGTGSNHGTYPVHVFGYHVEAVPGDPQSSTVTIVSHSRWR
ncbi:hypothetical protein BJ742DRAFT_452722 [Cladochytrium replicatum]|nr:hypothetical protein BJ742DRAFT_452722 [Cladochytrium replicatum]